MTDWTIIINLFMQIPFYQDTFARHCAFLDGLDSQI